MSITRNSNINTTNNGCSSTSSSKQSTSTATVIAANNSVTGTNYDIYTDTKATLPKKQPAYDYFKEPTVYAQIDHFKTMQHKSSSHASAHQQPHMTTMPSSASASNAYQMHHSTNIIPTTASSAAIGAAATAVAHQPNQYYQQQNQSQLQYGSGTALNNSNNNGTLSNSNTLTFSSIQSPSQPPQSLSTTSKQYSREIVTIRTPLLCSQQESCV